MLDQRIYYSFVKGGKRDLPIMVRGDLVKIVKDTKRFIGSTHFIVVENHKEGYQVYDSEND